MEKEFTQSGSKIQGKISYDQTEVAKAIEEELRSRASTVTVPGFRRGKAPLKLVENFIGREYIVEKAIDRLVNNGIQKFIEEYSIVPLKIRDLDFIERGDGKPLIFTFIIDVYPEVKIEDYKGLRRRLGVWKDVEGKTTVEKGDYVLVDIKDDPTKPFDEDKATGSIIHIGEGIVSPGDDEPLIGREIGESVEIKTKFPEDYYEESLRNKEVTLYVLIKGIKMLELPQVDEEFAKRFNYQSVEDIRKGFRQGIYRERLAQKEESMYQLIKDRLAEGVKVEIPEVMVRDRLEYWKRILYNNREAPEDFEEKNYQYALNDIKATLALRYIADKESLEVTEEEINRVITSWKVKNITEEVRNSAINTIKQDKALRFLLDLIKNREGEVEE